MIKRLKRYLVEGFVPAPRPPGPPLDARQIENIKCWAAVADEATGVAGCVAYQEAVAELCAAPVDPAVAARSPKLSPAEQARFVAVCRLTLALSRPTDGGAP